MKKLSNLIVALAGALGLMTVSTQANATAVDLELVLAMDVSSSVSGSEYNLQRTGYINAFNSASLATAIGDGALGSIAVSMVHWGSNAVQTIDWFLIDGTIGNKASDFANLISGTTTNKTALGVFTGSTAIGTAINFSDPLFASNTFVGTRSVIDISGDGTNNDGADLATARANALAGNTDTINGVTIGGGSLLTYYQNNVIGGPNAFAVSATNFADFGAAIESKLIKEIINAPEPITLALVSLGLLGMGATRRQRAAA